MSARMLWLLALFGAFRGVTAGAAEAVPLSVYGSLPGFEMSSLSDSGERLAIVGTANNQRRLFVLDGASKPILTMALADTKVRGIYWAGDSYLLLLRTDTVRLSTLDFTSDSAELMSMLVVPLEGGKPWFVFAGDKMITGGVAGFYGVRQKGGKFYGYFGGATFSGDHISGGYLSTTNPVLYEVDLATQKSRKLAPSIDDGGRRHWIIGPDGEISATMDFYKSKGNWIIRNRGGKRVAEGTQPKGGVALVGISATADAFIYSVEDEKGLEHWIEIPNAGGEGRELLADVAVRAPLFDSRTRQFMGYMLEADVPAYKFFDPLRQSYVNATLKAFPGRGVHLVDWNDRFDTFIVRTEGSADPGTWWKVAVKSGKAETIGLSYTLRSQSVGPVRMVSYKAADGLDIAAVLTLPPGSAGKNLPVVVMPHGGPTARDYPEFDWWAQALASRGYAVLQPNFRGSSGYGAAFIRAGYGEWGRKMQSDISEGLDFLVREGIADPRRACIVGASYGGYAALAGVTLQKGIYRCAVSVGGVADLNALVSTELTESGPNATLLRVLREEIGSGRDLRAVSPIRFAEVADAPILLVHGKDDTVVKYEQSSDMAAALRKAGKSVEFVTLEGEDHWLSRADTRLAMLNAVVAFVEKYNPAGSTQ